MSDFGWIVIGVIFVSEAASVSSFGTDSVAERIEACMTQSDMQYVRGNCVPKETND